MSMRKIALAVTRTTQKKNGENEDKNTDPGQTHHNPVFRCCSNLSLLPGVHWETSSCELDLRESLIVNYLQAPHVD